MALLGVALASVALVSRASPGSAAASLPAGFQDTAVLTGLVNPTDFAFSPDGRVFVTEKRGVLKIFKNLGDTTPTSLDMRVEVHNWWDRGMLGVAVDPHLADPDPATRRPYVYVLYTADA